MEKLDSIAGYAKEKEEILRLRYMLLEYRKYSELGIKIPKGMVLVGEPGIGKTALARAFAVQGINEIYITSSDCVGENSDTAIHEAFNKAKSLAPSVIIIDELDKLAGESSMFYDENKDCMKLLMKEMDSLDATIPMAVIATCNHKEYLDESLIRSGRFDRVIYMARPDENTRELIADLYLGKLGLQVEVNGNYIAKISSGYTGADIETAINEAAILAMDNKPAILTKETIRIAINRISFGELEKDIINNYEDYSKISAVHEAGHALVAAKLTPGSLFEVSIVPQGKASGYAKFIWDETKRESFQMFENKMRVRLAGHVSEKVVLGDYYIGSGSDIATAGYEIQDAASREGFYGYEYVDSGAKTNVGRPEGLKMLLNQLASRKLEEYARDDEKIISENREILDNLVDALMKKKVLTEGDIRTICRIDSAGQEQNGSTSD